MRFVFIRLAIMLAVIGAAADAPGQSGCGDHLMFFNGVLTTREEAADAALAISEALTAQGACGPVQLNVDVAYNQTDGLLDFFEAFVQVRGEPGASEFWRIMGGLIQYVPVESRNLFENLFVEWLREMIRRAEQVEAQELDDLISQVQVILNARQSEVVALAHSQGNLFANRVHDRLDQQDRQRFRIVAVATPAPRAAGDGPYTTFVGDPIELVIGRLAPNRRNDGICASVSNGRTCHSLVDSYLANPESTRRIVNQVLGINQPPYPEIELVSPAIPSLGVSEATVYAYGWVNGAPAAMVTLSSRRSTDVDGRNHECSSEVELSCIRQVTWHASGTSFLPVIGGWAEAPETSTGPTLYRLYSVGSHQIDLNVEDFDGGLATTTLLLHVRAAPSPGFIQFSSVQYSASEDTGTVQVIVERVGGSDGFVEAMISASGGTADTSDYEGLPQRVTFAPGDVSRIVSIAIVDDRSPEPAETIGLSLTLVCSNNPCQPNGVLGIPSEASLTIAANDQTSVPFTLLYPEGTQIVQMSLDGQVIRRLDLGRAVGYFDISDDLSRIVYSDNASQMWTYEVATGQSHPWGSAPWSQTLKWLPGSSTTFVHGASDGNLYSYNTVTRTSTLWQSRDTAQVFGKNVYRGGLEFSDATSGRVIARIGVGGAGGDGVFVGDRCSVDASHHTCNLRVVSNPAGTGTSWSSIAYGPSLTQDGRYAYYAERLNWNSHRVMRRELDGDGATVVYETTVGGDTGFGHTALFDNDQFLVFGDIYANGDRAIRLCDLGAPAGTSCSSTVLQTPGAFGGSIVVPVRWP